MVDKKIISYIIWIECQDAIASKNGVYVSYLWERYYGMGVECLKVNKARIQKDFAVSAAGVGTSVLIKVTRTIHHPSLQDLSCRLAAAAGISVLFRPPGPLHLSLQDLCVFADSLQGLYTLRPLGPHPT